VQLGSHLVSGNLIVLAGVIYAERLLYFPSAGFCLLLGAALDSLCLPVPGRPGTRRARPRVAAAILAALVAAGLARTHHECGHWRDEDTLFAATLRSAPRSPRAHFTLAKIRLRQGRHDEALRYLDQTLALWPDFSSAWYERGLLLARRGEGREAVAAFQINPEHAQAQLNLGLALHQLGRIREAESRLRKVLVRFPELTPARAALAELWMETGRYDDAATAYRRAVRDGRTDLAGALERAERLAATH
jgi:tetratricopeptide (TPR) repeat protein